MYSNAAVAGAMSTPAAATNVMAPQQANALQRLKIWAKLAKGELHTITKHDVEELFQVLDTEERGEITRDDLLVLRQIPGLSLSSEDVENLVNDADKDNSGKVSQEELFKALTQGELAYNVVLAALGQKKPAVKTTECHKEDLIEFLRFEYETKSSLWSLPQTLIFFAAFFVASLGHLSLSSAYKMQNALIGELEGEGPPYLQRSVHDVPSFWDWMEGPYLSSVFKNGPDDLEIWPYPGRVASYNQIIGAVSLSRTSAPPTSCLPSNHLNTLYDSRNGWCHKQEQTTVNTEFFHYHETREDLARQMSRLRKSPDTNTSWVDQNTTLVSASMLLYNGHLEAFTLMHLKFVFGGDGKVGIIMDMETFLAEPYRNILWIIPDIIFSIIILRMTYSECAELIPAIMNGIDGFQQYMQFWNLVDWMSIIVGVTVMTMWGLIVQTVSTDLQSKINELEMSTLDSAIFANHTFLTAEKFEMVMPKLAFDAKVTELHNLTEEVVMLHRWLRTVAFGYNFVLMMKFFKAFQANPRLNIVIKTMQTSAIDIIHFLIVFTVIFFVFASAAYVFFGSRMQEFSTPMRSTAYCWRILMGEFDVEAMEVVHPLAANMWIIIFQFLVLQVLLNMLLAIIMDTYAAVNEPRAETIWRQIREALHTARETRGHLDMWYLICELEDDDYQVHSDRVTSKSLRSAFEGQKMSKLNAEYLIRKTAEFTKAKEAKSELKMSDAVRLIARMQTTGLRVQEAVEQILEMMREERRRPQEERLDAIMRGEDPDALPRLRALAAASATTANNTGQKGHAPGGGYAAPGPAMSHSPTNATVNSQLAITATRSIKSSHDPNKSFDAGNRSFEADAASPMMTATAAMSSRSAPTLNQTGRTGGRRSWRQRLGTAGDGDDHPDILEGGAVLEELRSLRSYIEQRDSWMEQRLTALDKRCEKVERAADRMTTAMQGFDYREMMEAVERVAHFLQVRDAGGAVYSNAQRNRKRGAHKHGSVFEDSINGDEDDGDGFFHSEDHSEDMHNPAGEEVEVNVDPFLSSAKGRQMGRKLDHISEQVQELLSHAQESTETRKLLWKIDLNVRQTRTSVTKLEELGNAGARVQTDGANNNVARGNTNDAATRRPVAEGRSTNSPSPPARLSNTAGSMPRLPSVPDHSVR